MDELLHATAKWIIQQDDKIIVGISGHGASGKSTFSAKLQNLLGKDDVNYINTDPYIIGSNVRKYAILDYEYSGEIHRYKMTACHPAAHHTVSLERDITMIKDGVDFYTINTHYLKSTLISSHKNVTIVEGMSVAFIDPNFIDLGIYLYTDGETELSRRSVRDVVERSADIDYLRKSHDERRIQYELFMHPYHRNFDIVIKNSNDDIIVEKAERIFE
ncbi:uridine kinase family protein [Ornithinibacillus contaminans]|uniref:uridine kinase family protein n=1 Tax=Ornithinibacillus contaminans TaxID=694055 RepID=UPI00064D989A|nr:phosphoribulokinase [Ornithinibacillus contaminans]